MNPSGHENGRRMEEDGVKKKKKKQSSDTRTGNMMGEKKEISRLMTFFFFHSSLRFVKQKKTVNLPWSLGSLGGDCLATESEGPPPPARWFRSIIRLPPIIFALGRQLK